MDAGMFQTIDLDEGANLVSFYVLPDDNSVEDMLDPLSNNVSAVLSGGAAAQLLDGWGWIGSLTTLEYESGYWLVMNEADQLHLEGCDSPMLSGLVYDLEPGANLISYPDPNTADLSIAIPDEVEGLFSAIISEGGAAMNTDAGWIGSLTSFSGGSGYWVIVDESLSFSYNIDEGFGRADIDVYSQLLPVGYESIVRQSSEQAFYFVDYIELLDGEIENGDWIMTYNGEVITGIRQWQGVAIDVPAMGYSDLDANTQGYFVEGDIPTFKLLKNSTGELIELGGMVPEWSSNNIVLIKELVEVESIPEVFGIDQAYPNPFNPVTTLSFKLPMDSQVLMQVYNLQGRLVETLVDQNMNAGYHAVVWNADSHSSGVYFVKMVSGDQISTHKLLLVK